MLGNIRLDNEGVLHFQARPVSRSHCLGEGVHQEEVCTVVPPAPHSLGSCIGGRVTFVNLLSFRQQGLTMIKCASKYVTRRPPYRVRVDEALPARGEVVNLDGVPGRPIPPQLTFRPADPRPPGERLIR